MKTYEKIRAVVIVVIAVVLAYFNITYAVGWLVGWAVLTILGIARDRFFNHVLDLSEKVTGKVIMYNIFVFGLLWIPALLSFLFPQYINPFALIATYALDRIELYIKNLFFPKETSPK